VSLSPNSIYITRWKIGQGDQICTLPDGPVKLEYGNKILGELTSEILHWLFGLNSYHFSVEQNKFLF
jgi:hypothetical protein